MGLGWGLEAECIGIAHSGVKGGSTKQATDRGADGLLPVDLLEVAEDALEGVQQRVDVQPVEADAAGGGDE
jgi:hypothetical protein